MSAHTADTGSDLSNIGTISMPQFNSKNSKSVQTEWHLILP